MDFVTTSGMTSRDPEATDQDGERDESRIDEGATDARPASGSTIVRDDVTESFSDERPDQIDRSVVVNSWLKTAAMFALRLLIVGIALYALWYVLKTFWGGVLPVILAVIVCTVLAPPTTWMRKIGIPSALGSLISLLTFFAGLGLLVSIIAPDIASHSQVLYLQAVEGVQRLQLWAQGEPLNLDGEDIEQVVNDIASWFQEQAGTIASGVFAGISTATSAVLTLVVVLVLTFFFLKDGHKFLPWLRGALGRRAGLHATELLSRAWTSLGGYIRTQAIVSFVDAACIGIGIWIVGVPMAFTLAVITFIAGFIPIVGAVTAGALAVIVALVSLGFTEAIIVLIIILAVQQIEGNVLQPILQSRAMNLHAVIILISVSVGGGLFGLVGAFLAVPFAAMVAVVFRYFQDMTALHAGEKEAKEIEFVTDEGMLIGEISERESEQQRRIWREELGWAPENVPEPSVPEVGSPHDENSRRSRINTQISSRAMAQIFEKIKRRSR
ncbi:AI-2E family transporter [Corynebacterium cystitidis]|uniref:AI-2E family transporter n=1 Tax=Corynebacterium cystitidis TaxID=35757 RepID=UPI00358DBC15